MRYGVRCGVRYEGRGEVWGEVRGEMRRPAPPALTGLPSLPRAAVGKPMRGAQPVDGALPHGLPPR